MTITSARTLPTVGRVLLLALLLMLVAGGATSCSPATSNTRSSTALTPSPNPSAASSMPVPPAPAAAPNAVPVGRAGTPRGAVPLRVDLGDPSSVARAVAVTTWTWDARLDNSPQDAARRAAVWMTPAAAALARSVRTSGGGADWLALARRDGWTTATAADDTEPPPPPVDGATARRVFVTLTPHPGGTGMPVQHWTVVVSVQVTTGGVWRASGVSSQPTNGTDGTGGTGGTS